MNPKDTPQVKAQLAKEGKAQKQGDVTYPHPWGELELTPKIRFIANPQVPNLAPGAVVIALQRSLDHLETGALNGWNIEAVTDSELTVMRFQHELERLYWDLTKHRKMGWEQLMKALWELRKPYAEVGI